MNEQGVVIEADMDKGATKAEVAAVQELFDEAGLDTQVTATYIAKGAGELHEWVLWIYGHRSALYFLAGLAGHKVVEAASSAFGKKIGEAGGELIKQRLERLCRIRGKEGAIVVQDPSIRVELVINTHEPAAALAELVELVEEGKLADLEGQLNQVEYIEGRGWVKRL